MATTTIGGNRFTVAELPAFRAFLLQPRLAPILAEVAAALFGIIADLDGTELAGEPGPAKADEDGAPVAPASLKAKLATMTIDDVLNIDLAKHVGELSAAVTRISQLLRPKELEGITRELLAGATMDGVQLLGTPGQGELVDIKLMGRTMDLWKLIFFAVQVNYPDVFSRRAEPAAPAPASP